MKPSAAFFYSILRFGTKIMKDPKLANILCDFGLFKTNVGYKHILIKLIEDNFLYDLTIRNSKEQCLQNIQRYAIKTGYNEKWILQLVQDFRRTLRLIYTIKKLRDTAAKEIDEIANVTVDEYGFSYTQDFRVLLYDEEVHPENVKIKDGCMVIAEDALAQPFSSITIPKSVMYICKGALPIDPCTIINESPYFVFKDGLLLTSDKRRLLRCYNRSTIVNIPKEVVFFDDHAFPTHEFDAHGISYYGWESPYFLRISSNRINKFHYYEGKCIVPNEIMKEELLNRKLIPENTIVGDVYIDEYGVIYSEDLTTLLCFPKEIKLKDYRIIDNCVRIEDDAFAFMEGTPSCIEDIYEDENGNKIVPSSSSFIEGNSIEILRFPSNLKSLGVCALHGLVNLKTIILDKENAPFVIKLLVEYSNEWETEGWLNKISFYFE